MEISGSTRIVAVMGHPVGHTLSPAMQNAAFRALDMDWIYVAFDVAPEGLAEALHGCAALGMRGANVTVSLKEVAASVVDRLGPSATRLGSVNTIEFTEDGLVGHSTDGVGVLRSLKEDLGIDPAGKDVVVLGAGGAAAAIVHAVLEAGARSVTIANRTFERGKRLRESVLETAGADAPLEAVPLTDLDRWEHNVDLVVNATYLGWKPDDPMPVPESFLRDGMAVLDTCYNPDGTPLLEAARRKGLPCADGIGMLVHQGAAGFEIWTGRQAPVDVMRNALEGR
jgi:shikimate dehydrogenase